MVIIYYCCVNAVSIAFRDDFWGDFFFTPHPPMASQISRAHSSWKDEGERIKDYGLRIKD
jgi:hypothetical protein